MDWKNVVETIKDLCYQCQFKKVVTEVDRYSDIDPGSQHFFDLQLYKSQALFEMHQVSVAKSLLRELTNHHEKQSERYLYVMAKLHYADKDWEKAARLFRLLADHGESVKDYYKALLGLANVYFSINKNDDLKRLIPELEELLELVTVDQRLSYYLLKANVNHRIDGLTQKAKNRFHCVIEESYPRQWNYFIVKSLYGLSSMFQDLGKQESLEATLEILRCYLKTDESIYLTYLVNEKFKDVNFSLTSTLQFDSEFKRIGVQNKWIPLHDKPLIFGFLEFLHRKGTFVSKQEIAQELWPNQDYKPRIHDPRIFDIARRVRALIEPYENQPVCLLSGRFGYKLASRDHFDPPPQGGRPAVGNWQDEIKVNSGLVGMYYES
ncbi:MAG: hypothetical protein ACOH5I_18235 [Oligoflexus sp.]